MLTPTSEVTPPVPPPRKSKTASQPSSTRSNGTTLHPHPPKERDATAVPPAARTPRVAFGAGDDAADADDVRSFLTALHHSDRLEGGESKATSRSGSSLAVTPRARSPAGARQPHPPQPPMYGQWNRGQSAPMDPVFALWVRDNPHATADEINAELRRRMIEVREKERAVHLAMMKRYYEELNELNSTPAVLPVSAEPHEMLEAESTPMSSPDGLRSLHSSAPNLPALTLDQANASPSPPVASPGRRNDAHSPLQHHQPARRCVMPVPDPREYDAQRLAWELLIAKPVTNSMSYANFDDKALPPSTAAHATASSDVTTWVQSSWRHGTHRHEAAATRIQCAFRCYVAKRRCERQRLVRRQTIEAILAAEEQQEITWVIAVATREESAKAAAMAEKRVRLIRGFLSRVRAIRQRRLAARQRTNMVRNETREFSAVKIQALVRGHLARRSTYMLRHPEIALEKELAHKNTAAARIQCVAKGMITRERIKRWRRAALRIQTCFRRHRAAVFVADLHVRKAQLERSRLQAYSARVLQRFFQRLVRQKYARLRRHKVQIATLQRVSRGFTARVGEMAELWLAKRGDAATAIQSLVRMRQAKKAVSQRQAQLHRDDETTYKHHAASVITRAMRRNARQRHLARLAAREAAVREIQRVFRGHLGRQRARQIAQANTTAIEERLRYDSAVAIQAVVRGRQTRARLRPAAAVTSTAPPAPHGGSNAEVDHRNAAAVIIQRCYRTNVRQPQFARDLDRAARVIVTFFRCVPSMKRVRQLQYRVQELVLHGSATHAANLIQLWARVVLARLRTRALRSQRNAEFREVQRNEAAMVITRFMRRIAARCRMARRRRGVVTQPQLQQGEL